MLARLNYFNVGLFGEVLAMAGPLLLWALIDRRRLGLNRAVVALLLIASLAALASLFLTFSKSGYLATTVADRAPAADRALLAAAARRSSWPPVSSPLC